MSNEMVGIKKQVSNTSKVPFRPLMKGWYSSSQPPNIISNFESDEEEDEESALSTKEEEEEEEKLVEAHGLWDFILTTLENEEEGEALRVETRSKKYVNSSSSNNK